MRDHYIETNGVSATLKVPDVRVYTAGYHELDWAASTWTDTSIKVIVGPLTKDRKRKLSEGLVAEKEDLQVTFKSDTTIAIGNLVVVGSVIYRLIDLSTRPYHGILVQKGILRIEPQGA